MSLNMFRNIEIILSISYDHNDIKLGINDRKNVEKLTNTRQVDNTLRKTSPSKHKAKGKLKKYMFIQIKMETQYTKAYEIQKKNF